MDDQGALCELVFSFGTDLKRRPQATRVTFILLDLKAPGIEIRPIILINGLHETNMVYYDDVRVAVENTVGEVGKGWGIRKYLLAHERMSSGSLGPHKKLLSQLKSIAADGETSG
ncbi:MAG: hypothetical protein VYB59_17915, partial [Pseudomonadota bacterium]|nr:hypothetical protein [Pseudomonadota bacterium]